MYEILPSVEPTLPDNENKKLALGEHEETFSQVNLLDMPVEIILKILSHLEPPVLKNTISKVCKRFEDILAHDSRWKYWVRSKIKGCYPPLPDLKIYHEQEIDWGHVCVEIDIETKKWTNSEENFKHIIVKDVHYYSVDTVLLVNGGETCISGGRDDSIAVWNIKDLRTPEIPEKTNDDDIDFDLPPPTSINVKPKHIIHDAHAGWVWDLAADSLKNTTFVYSASWDNTVRAWDLNSGFECIQTFRCGMSALSVTTCENTVMAGLYSKKILAFDVRSGPTPINWYKPHRGPVVALTCFNTMIASISKDKTLAIWDKTAGKLIKSDIKIPSQQSFPVCINWKPTAMYIGDSGGCLHLFNPEKLSFVKSHEIWPWPASSLLELSNKITSCYQTEGNIIVCSDGGEIKFMHNSNPPQSYASIKTSTGDITQMRYFNNILVTGSGDSALEFWIPEETYKNNLLINN